MPNDPLQSLPVRSRSSAGQSERFLNARSEVRDLPGTPRCFQAWPRFHLLLGRPLL